MGPEYSPGGGVAARGVSRKIENGRERTGLCVQEPAVRAVRLSREGLNASSCVSYTF